MPYNLKNRNVLVTGSSRGLGAVISEKFALEGANVAINYANDKTAADELVQKLKAHGTKIVALKADCGVIDEINHLVNETIKELGGLDVLIGNAGWSKFVPTQFGDLEALDESDWDKCWAVNVKGQMALLRAALPTFNTNADGGVMIITNSVAGTSLSGSSLAYSVTKAAQLHLMRCLAQTQGPKIRINAVLPGLLLTEWGRKYGPDAIEKLKERATLKKATDLSDCADMFVAIAKNSSMTGQRVAVDAGINVPSI